MSDGEDSHKDDVLVSLRRIMRGGRPAAEGGETKRSGGLFGRRRSAEAEPDPTPEVADQPEPTEEAPTEEASAEEAPVVADADAGTTEPEAVPQSAASEDAPAAAPMPETAEPAEAGDEPLAADDELLSLGDFMMEPIEGAPEQAAEAAVVPDEAPQLAEEALEAATTASTDDVALPEGAELSEPLGDEAPALEPFAETVAEDIDPGELPPVPEPERAEDAALEPEAALEPDFAADDALPEALDALTENQVDPVPTDALAGGDTQPEAFAAEEGAAEEEIAATMPAGSDAPMDDAVAETPMQEPSPDAAPVVDPAVAAVAAAAIPAALPPGSAETLPAATAEGTGGAVIMDESALEDMIRRVIRTELVEGELGRNISANVRRLIEDEIARAMLSRPKD